jgi:hypothetical protein
MSSSTLEEELDLRIEAVGVGEVLLGRGRSIALLRPTPVVPARQWLHQHRLMFLLLICRAQAGGFLKNLHESPMIHTRATKIQTM